MQKPILKMAQQQLILAATLAAAVLAQSCQPPTDIPALEAIVSSADLAFVNVNVVPMDEERILEHYTVLVERDLVTWFGPAGEFEVPADVEVIDGTDKYLMPGLVDSHVHAWNENDLKLYVANGITTVRNLSGAPLHLEWRARTVEDPAFIAPTIYTAGPLIDGDPPTWPTSTVVTTVEQGRSRVAEYAADGYDFIKVYNRLSAGAYKAIVASAAESGLTVQGHIPDAVSLFQALASGHYAIEHFSGYQTATYSASFAIDPSHDLRAQRFQTLKIAEGLVNGELEWGEVFDPSAVERAVRETLKADTWNIPTIVVNQLVAPDEYEKRARAPGTEFVAPSTLAGWKPWGGLDSDQMRALRALHQGFGRRLIAALHQAGGNLLIGTDTPNPFVLPGFSVHEELSNFVSAGLSPYETLVRATRMPAEFMGMTDRVGIIAPQQRADLLLLEANPLVDVANVRQIAGISLRGRWLSASSIGTMLEEIKVDVASGGGH